MHSCSEGSGVSFRHPGVRSGEVYGAGTKMIGALFGGRPGGGGMKVGIADDGDVIAQAGQRFQRLREFEAVAFLGGRPIVLLGSFTGAAGGTMHHFDAGQARARRRGSTADGSLRGHHRIQERQRQAHAHAAQHRAPGEMFFGEIHPL
jgi:hypothetical protein